jgi:hypothetical protein
VAAEFSPRATIRTWVRRYVRWGGIGAAHYFHTRNPEPDFERHAPDDVETASISWPNYHSGRNGDFQRIVPVAPTHELLREPILSGLIKLFPAHPHEGAVGVPPGEQSARIVAPGQSLMTGRPFNLVVAFERSRDLDGNLLGRGVAHSSFHHFADYNWEIGRGAPSFVTEPEGQGMKTEPRHSRTSNNTCAISYSGSLRHPDADSSFKSAPERVRRVSGLWDALNAEYIRMLEPRTAANTSSTSYEVFVVDQVLRNKDFPGHPARS